MIDWEWFDDANTFRLFIYCLLRANFEDRNWRGIKLQRGQLITSQPKLAHSLKLSIMQIRNSLNKLKRTGEITVYTTADYSIITVKNYNYYQPNNSLNNAQITQERQASNRLTTTDNKLKNTINKSIISVLSSENEKPTPEKKFIKPSLDEVKNYISEKNLTVDPERFFYYYEANGWTQGNKKMKSWQAAAQYWQRTEKKEQKEEENWSDYVDRVLGGNKNNGNNE